jgi:FKBP-type peptidyl-prolyl cis-trans isomerase 2
LSLGGRAAKVAKAISHELLGRRDGLAILLAKLEQAFGEEQQTVVRMDLKTFMRQSRPRGTPGHEFITNFELKLDKATESGMYINDVMRTHMLVDAARLSQDEEEYLLREIQHDYSRYQQCKQILRRMT